MSSFTHHPLLSKAEEVADDVLRRTKPILPTLSRLCLISTFLQNGIRMFFEWNIQIEYMESSWSCGTFFANMFVFIILVGQIGGCFMILLRWKVGIACTLLCGILCTQAIAYNIFRDHHLPFFFKYLALLGALLLVLAESRQLELKSLFAGVPTLVDNKSNSYLQLTGRILLVFMFIPLLRFELSFTQILRNIFGSFLMLLVAVGYKTKLSTLILVLWLTTLNLFCLKSWWNAGSKEESLFFEYIFFLTLSAIGGLIMIVSLGPGRVSIDERKRK